MRKIGTIVNIYCLGIALTLLLPLPPDRLHVCTVRVLCCPFCRALVCFDRRSRRVCFAQQSSNYALRLHVRVLVIRFAPKFIVLLFVRASSVSVCLPRRPLPSHCFVLPVELDTSRVRFVFRLTLKAHACYTVCRAPRSRASYAYDSFCSSPVSIFFYVLVLFCSNLFTRRHEP